MNEDSPRKKDEILNDVLKYLANHRILTMATVSPDGEPDATALEYAFDGTTIYVSVRAGSQKVTNLKNNTRVFYEIHDDIPIEWESVKNLKGLQVSANCTIIPNNDPRFEHVFQIMLTRFPVFSRIPSNKRVILEFKPKKIWYLNYERKFFHREEITFK